MSRVKAGSVTRSRHKKILKRAKGYFGRRKNTFKVANQAVEKAGQYAYRDRKVKKREFRRLWIQRINAGCRLNGIKYSTFMNGLKKVNLNFNRKVLADIAALEPESFKEIVAKVKAAWSNPKMNYDEIIQSALKEVEDSNASEKLEQVRIKYFGKKFL